MSSPLKHNNNIGYNVSTRAARIQRLIRKLDSKVRDIED